MTLFLDTKQTSDEFASLKPNIVDKLNKEFESFGCKIDDCFQTFDIEKSTEPNEPEPLIKPPVDTPTSLEPSLTEPKDSSDCTKEDQTPVPTTDPLERTIARPIMPTYYSDILVGNIYRTISTCASFSSFASENLGLKKITGKKKASAKESLVALQKETDQNQDPRIQLEYAQQLLDAATQIEDTDPEKAEKARERLYQEAQRLIKKLASHNGVVKQGYPEAQFFLANCYGTGSMGLATEPEKAFGLYLQGSKQNHPQCTFRAAVCYEVGAGTKRDGGHAMQLYRKAANLGDPVAMYKLGMILLKGFLNQPVNPREGINWLKRAAELASEDHPHALHELGLVFEKEGIPSVIPDANYARELFTKAAQYGYAASQFRLGQAYENGFLNCPVDPRRSIAWYSKAAEQGDIHAEFALSGWYLTGADGVLPQNDGEAYMWAKKAADKGLAKAEYAVGYYLETGTGTKKDMKEARQWYRRAAAQDHSKASQRLIELKYEANSPRQEDSELAKRERNSECGIM